MFCLYVEVQIDEINTSRAMRTEDFRFAKELEGPRNKKPSEIHPNSFQLIEIQ